ncbi:MAG: hypothetical protein QGH37_20080 [Candidatus Poribacteria bacterium]|nr:hypothetical protein [Candidatus Poribacteria bacterium]
MNRNAGLSELYEGMTIPEIHREIGCSARLYEWYNKLLSPD